MDADQVSLAIGKGGYNINLAENYQVSKLMYIEMKILSKMMLI